MIYFCSVDNSEYSRNGDYHPSRLAAQLDATQSLFAAKRRANVESTIAVMCMSGDCPKTLVSLSTDQRKLLAACSTVHPQGDCAHLLAALKVAQIILKARTNPNQRQRVVLFVASPLDASKVGEPLVALGRQLRKNGVAVDVVGVAGADNHANAAIIEPFIDAVDVGADVDDGDRQSRFLDIPAGESILDAVTVHLANAAAQPASHALSPNDFDDADMDPELAMALKMSLEEEMARQAYNGASGEGKASEDSKDQEQDDDVDMDDPELARAIAMSLEKN